MFFQFSEKNDENDFFCERGNCGEGQCLEIYIKNVTVYLTTDICLNLWSALLSACNNNHIDIKCVSDYQFVTVLNKTIFCIIHLSHGHVFPPFSI